MREHTKHMHVSMQTQQCSHTVQPSSRWRVLRDNQGPGLGLRVLLGLGFAGTKKTQATQETLKVFLPERHRFGLLLALLAWIFFLFITRWLKLRLTGILPPLDLGPPHLSLLAPVLLLLLRQGGLNVVGKLLQVPPASTALAVGIPEVLSVGRVDVELTLARRPSYTGDPPIQENLLKTARLNLKETLLE